MRYNWHVVTYICETIPTMERVSISSPSKSFVVCLCNTSILPFLASPYQSGDWYYYYDDDDFCLVSAILHTDFRLFHVLACISSSFFLLVCSISYMNAPPFIFFTYWWLYWWFPFWAITIKLLWIFSHNYKRKYEQNIGCAGGGTANGLWDYDRTAEQVQRLHWSL